MTLKVFNEFCQSIRWFARRFPLHSYKRAETSDSDDRCCCSRDNDTCQISRYQIFIFVFQDDSRERAGTKKVTTKSATTTKKTTTKSAKTRKWFLHNSATDRMHYIHQTAFGDGHTKAAAGRIALPWNRCAAGCHADCCKAVTDTDQAAAMVRRRPSYFPSRLAARTMFIPEDRSLQTASAGCCR